MRVLIDTNIFIHREDHKVIPSNLQELSKILNDNGVSQLIHPLSIQEIEGDKDEDRKRVCLSKIKAYPILDSPPTFDDDAKFINIVGESTSPHEIVDKNILYCVKKDAVDFLITEDQGIHKKAETLGLEDRVFTIDDALDFFGQQFLDIDVQRPYAIQQIPIHNLSFNDRILESLKEDYGADFERWWKKISREGRKAWVYFKSENELGAILILKIEDEAIEGAVPNLPSKKRVKICTLKVTQIGFKIGETFIKMSIDCAIKHDIDEIYLTHFSKEQDILLALVGAYGFEKKAERRGERIYIKNTRPDRRIDDHLELNAKYYPSFYDGEEVNKFIVPIQPQYHKRLFPEFKHEKEGVKQVTLAEFFSWPRELNVQGNTIKKAYISHALTKRISRGDILLFYRSQDLRSVTSIGVVESVQTSLTNPDDITRYVGKRTVYSPREIQELAQKPTIVILFTINFHLQNPLNHEELAEIGISTPMTINLVDHDKYLNVKQRGGIDERFTFN